MTPLLPLLAILAAMASDGQSEWRRKDAETRLRRRLGLWKNPPSPWPGTIDARMQWISEQFGLPIAVLTMRAAAMLGVEQFDLGQHSSIGPFLPWVAWRLYHNDAPDLRLALEAYPDDPVDADGTPLPYDGEKARGQLEQVFRWFDESHPDLHRFTWDEAVAAEEPWFAKNLPTYENLPPGELVYRFAPDEDGESHTVQTVDGDLLFELGKLTGTQQHLDHHYKIPMHHGRVEMHVLRAPDGEPLVIFVYNSQGYITSLDAIIGRHVEPPGEWVGTDEDPYLAMSVEYLEAHNDEPVEDQGVAGSALWLASMDDVDLAEQILANPSILEKNQIAELLTDGRLSDDFSLREAWAEAANRSPDQISWLPSPDELSIQHPTRRWLHWIDTGEWDDSLVHTENSAYTELMADWEEIVERHDVQEGASPWEIRSHDMLIAENPATAPGQLRLFMKMPDSRINLQIKVQLAIVGPQDAYHREDNYWTVYRRVVGVLQDARGNILGQTSDSDFDAWDVPLTEGPEGSVEMRRGVREELEKDGEEIESTASLDHALKAAWTAMTEGVLKRLDEDWEGRSWRDFFVPNDLVEPREGIKHIDVIEARRFVEG